MGASCEIGIRAANRADISCLCGLLALLFGQEAEFQPDVKRQARGLSLILEEPEAGLIFCAVHNGDIVGMVSILFTLSSAAGGCVAWLEDMVVHPDYRGRSIGERLLRAAIDDARSASCSRITLLTDRSNTSAQRFYSRAGFVLAPQIPFRIVLT